MKQLGTVKRLRHFVKGSDNGHRPQGFTKQGSRDTFTTDPFVGLNSYNQPISDEVIQTLKSVGIAETESADKIPVQIHSNDSPFIKYPVFTISIMFSSTHLGRVHLDTSGTDAASHQMDTNPRKIGIRQTHMLEIVRNGLKQRTAKKVENWGGRSTISSSLYSH
jgi:hypothetical protein